MLFRSKKLYFNTAPAGFELTLDGFDIRTPKDKPLEVISWVNHNITIDVKDQNNMVFDKWSDGIRSRHSLNTVRDQVEEGIKTAKFVLKADDDASRWPSQLGADVTVKDDESVAASDNESVAAKENDIAATKENETVATKDDESVAARENESFAAKDNGIVESDISKEERECLSICK